MTLFEHCTDYSLELGTKVLTKVLLIVSLDLSPQFSEPMDCLHYGPCLTLIDFPQCHLSQLLL